MIKRLIGIFSPNRSASKCQGEVETKKGIGIQVDRPIEHVSDDLFDRAAFARQIADIVALRRDPSSVVVGLYGPWGDGKTSTLAMIKEWLRSDPDIITMDYNPWFYGDSTQALTRSFFFSIQAKLEKSGFFSRENIGELMANYGKSIPYVGDAVKRLGEVITTEALTATRDKVGAILRKHGKKVVIFIDDIDRLDRSDIQTLFKLVRLSGGFDHTTYVLAFDDGVVADALGEAYGAGGSVAGRRFLEKIVQVPLHLPPAKAEKLRELMFVTCDRVLTENNLEIAPNEGSELGAALATGLVHALKTPRQVKLFENAISFAIPLLRGEVRAVDQVQIEALRVFYPTVYDVVRKNPELVLRSGEQRGRDDHGSSTVDVVISAIEDEEERASVREFLVGLFPRLGAMGYGNDWDRRWAEQKRVCSRDYFQRYFTYAVPTGDIPDLMIEELVDAAAKEDKETVGVIISNAYQEGGAELLIRKLRGQEKTIPLIAISTIVSEISASASTIPISHDLFLSDFAVSQAASLVVALAARTGPSEQDRLLAVSAEGADSLFFVAHLIRKSQAKERREGDNTSLPPERVYPLAAILLNRMQQIAQNENLFDEVGDHLGKIITTIRWSGSEDTVGELRALLAHILAADSSGAVQLVRAMSGRSQGSDGVTSISDVTRDTYDAIAELVDPTQVYERLLKRYGEEISGAEWLDAEDDSRDLDQRIANQFAYVHLHLRDVAESEEAE